MCGATLTRAQSSQLVPAGYEGGYGGYPSNGQTFDTRTQNPSTDEQRALWASATNAGTGRA